MAFLSLNNVTKVYRQRRTPVTAIRNLTLQIDAGEYTVIAGPSGCGKTTILRLISGLENATSGTIAVDGHTVNDVAPRDRNVAMVFQNYALYPHMTVFGNMAFGLNVRRVPNGELRDAVQRIADMLEIADLLDRRPHTLSGGQQQRVALGRAIVRKPKVFLLDEPLSNLDARLRLSLRAGLRRLHGQLRTTFVHVTHDQEEAMTLADRLVVMDRGEVMQHAEPGEVYARPANRFVAEFMGHPPMNFHPARLRLHDGDLCLFAPELAEPIAMPRESTPVLHANPDGDVSLGVRPEMLIVTDGAIPHPPDGPRSHARWHGCLQARESTGDRALLRVRLEQGGAMLAAVSNDAPWRVDDRVSLACPATALHLFQPGAYGPRLG